jgi:hypothetical protein
VTKRELLEQEPLVASSFLDEGVKNPEPIVIKQFGPNKGLIR